MDTDEARVFERFLELYGGLPRAAPGSEETTRRALALLPSGPRRRVLDLGCGPGAQTLTVASALPEATILALDILPQMVRETRRRCAGAGVRGRVMAVVADMGAPPVAEAAHDLIWSEGAIYNLGVEQALRLWRPLLAAGGSIGFTDVIWLRSDPPPEIVEWWTREYPAITNVDGVRHAISAAGFELMASFELSSDDWWNDYYGPLEAAIPAFVSRRRDDELAAEVAHDAATELEMHRRFGDWYSYGFFVVRPVS
jgi:ubiquinone/menaquinone biosynthesis C-methylase UbiE